jgi:hypothetical protein
VLAAEKLTVDAITLAEEIASATRQFRNEAVTLVA